MQIILLSKSAATARVLAVGRRWPLFIGLLLGVLLSAGLFHVGYLYGRGSAEPDLAAVTARAQAVAAERARETAAARRQVDHHLNALALRLGNLQAHVIRLDALGERLTEMAELDPAEFDFSESPARGGPESGEAQPATAPPDLESAMDELLDRLGDREQKLTLLEEFMLNRSLARRIEPSGRPVTEGWISSGFGYRNDPFTGKRDRHEGVDFAGRPGSDIVAVASGVVTWSGNRSGFGVMVELDHGNGYVTRYAHNKKNLVAVGDKVDRGQLIARMGSSGRSTGTHVHFEVLRDGKAVNPMGFIRAAR
jgi:murein DD-endopeptidase MepM/ murein hydrolase activator NlpD